MKMRSTKEILERQRRDTSAFSQFDTSIAPTDPLKVPPERVRWIDAAPGQTVCRRLLKLAQRLPGLDPCAPASRSSQPDLVRRRRTRFDTLGRDEQHAVVVTEDDVIGASPGAPRTGPVASPSPSHSSSRTGPGGSCRS